MIVKSWTKTLSGVEATTQYSLEARGSKLPVKLLINALYSEIPEFCKLHQLIEIVGREHFSPGGDD